MTLSIGDSAWGGHSQLSTALCGTSGPVTMDRSDNGRIAVAVLVRVPRCVPRSHCRNEIRGTAYLTAYQPKRKARRRGVLASQRAFSAPQEGVEPPTKRFVRDELTSPVISRPYRRLRTAWTCLTRARFSYQIPRGTEGDRAGVPLVGQSTIRLEFHR